MSEFTTDWFSANIPVWEQVFLPLKDKPLHVLEIGSYEGRSTVWMLENVLLHKDSKITCVDPYKPYSDLDKFPVNWGEVEARFKKNTEPYKDKIVSVKEESTSFLKRTSDMYDVIYVDGGHTSEQCLIDGVLSHLVLRKGGIIIFDDYMWSQLAKAPNVPRAAIDAFMECFAQQYQFIFAAYQVILKKL